MPEELTLPTEMHIPMFDGIPDDFSMIVFGLPKVGKTTFASEFPKSLILQCDPKGMKYVKGKKLDINNLETLRKAWDLLKEDNEYETVVLDTLDHVAKWIEFDICQELGLKSIMSSKKGDRNQWTEYQDRVLMLLDAWGRLGKRMIFLAHTKKAETDGDGVIISPKSINLYGQTAGNVLAIVENIGHMYAVQDEQGKTIRRLSFKSGVYVQGGSRHPMLDDKTIDLPKGGAYKAFEAVFKGSNGGFSAEMPTKKTKGAK